MVNRFRFLNDNNEDRIIEQIEKALNQYKDIRLVKRCSKRIGLKLRGFLTNDNLELYFDVYRNKRNICYIAKGWGDAGFRIGDIVTFNKGEPKFKEKFYEVIKACSRDLISTGFNEKEKNRVDISLEIGIYQDGFNEKVLKDVTKTFERALDRIRKILTS